MNHMNLDETLRNFLNATQVARRKMQKFLIQKTIPEIKNTIIDWSNQDLEWLCNDLSLEDELYEICSAVQQILDERESNGTLDEFNETDDE